MPMRQRDSTISFSLSVAAPSALGAPTAGGVLTINEYAVPDVTTLERSASELIAVNVVPVLDVDVPDIFKV